MSRDGSRQTHKLSGGRGRTLVCVCPVPGHCVLCNFVVIESTSVKVEDCELVLGHDIVVGLYHKSSPYVCQSVFEVRRNAGIEVSFRVAGNVKGSLVVEHSNAVDVDVVVAAHFVAMVFFRVLVGGGL